MGIIWLVACYILIGLIVRGLVLHQFRAKWGRRSVHGVGIIILTAWPLLVAVMLLPESNAERDAPT